MKFQRFATTAPPRLHPAKSSANADGARSHGTVALSINGSRGRSTRASALSTSRLSGRVGVDGGVKDDKGFGAVGADQGARLRGLADCFLFCNLMLRQEFSSA